MVQHRASRSARMYPLTTWNKQIVADARNVMCHSTRVICSSALRLLQIAYFHNDLINASLFAYYMCRCLVLCCIVYDPHFSWWIRSCRCMMCKMEVCDTCIQITMYFDRLLFVSCGFRNWLQPEYNMSITTTTTAFSIRDAEKGKRKRWECSRNGKKIAMR